MSKLELLNEAIDELGYFGAGKMFLDFAVIASIIIVAESARYIACKIFHVEYKSQVQRVVEAEGVAHDE